MPAIASLEDLKAAQKEGVSIYAMLYALCFFTDTQHETRSRLECLRLAFHGRVLTLCGMLACPEQLKGEGG